VWRSRAAMLLGSCGASRLHDTHDQPLIGGKAPCFFHLISTNRRADSLILILAIAHCWPAAHTVTRSCAALQSNNATSRCPLVADAGFGWPDVDTYYAGGQDGAGWCCCAQLQLMLQLIWRFGVASQLCYLLTPEGRKLTSSVVLEQPKACQVLCMVFPDN
jgi:hypothetical protein